MGCLGGEDHGNDGFDPTKGGPMKNRSCTDVICGLLFVVFVIAFIVIGIWGFLMGNPALLIYPTDYQGNVCGVGPMSEKPNLFYFNLLACGQIAQTIVNMGCPTPSICVADCPKKTFTFLTNQLEDFICKYDINVTAMNKNELVSREDCAAYYIEEAPVARRCLPKVITDAANLVDKNNGNISVSELEKGVKALLDLINVQTIGQNVVEDLAKSWFIILFFIGLAIILSFVIIVLMRWIAGPIVLICILLFLAFFSFAVYYCFTKYVQLKDVQQNTTLQWTTDLNYYINLYQTWLALGIIAAIILGIAILIALVLRTRLLIALSLIKEGSKAVSNMIFTLLWPLIPLLLQIGVIAFWLSSAIYLASTGNANYQQINNSTGIIQSIPCDPQENSTAGKICSFVKYGDPRYVIFLEIFQVFVWLWAMNFVIALGQMTLAGAFASYYWAFDKSKDVPLLPVTYSLGRCIRYHMGSMAFGALILAICQMIRLFLEFLDRRLKGAENMVARFVIKCLKCCFWCLEKFIKYINRNAYIMVAITGRNFCSSAMHAFGLIFRNFLRAAVLDGVTDFLIFLSKLFIIGGLGVLSFFLFSGELAKAAPGSAFSDFLNEKFTPNLNYYLIPVILIIIGTYVIASLFFSVYCMAIDTLFLCFLEDLDRNDGTPEKPYFMSKELLKILGKKNKISKEHADTELANMEQTAAEPTNVEQTDKEQANKKKKVKKRTEYV